MSNYVRVTDLDTGHKLSVLESEVANGNYRVLKADAVNELGDALPPEHNAVKPSASTGQTATDKNEES